MLSLRCFFFNFLNFAQNIIEPRHEKTNVLVSDLVRNKPGFTATEAVTAKLICVFVFAYAICWFSHDAADIYSVHVRIASVSRRF